MAIQNSGCYTGIIDFAPYTLIDYSREYLKDLHHFLDQGYKSVGYTSLELDTLDNDLYNIETVYASPSCFKLLIDADGKIIGTVAVKIQGKES